MGIAGGIGSAWASGASTASAWTGFYRAKSQASAYRWQAEQTAKNYELQAAAAQRNAGEAQRAGWDTAALRMEALGREVSGQRVNAAGSGIDISSSTVGRVERASRQAAGRDVDAISRSAYLKSAAYTQQAYSAMVNADSARIQGRLQSKLASLQARVGFVTNHIQGAMQFGTAVASMWGGGAAGGSGFGAGNAGGGVGAGGTSYAGMDEFELASAG